ncbi:MAG: TlpA family protein disulfide reductase [Gemmatimonadales bacterium]|jgi:thiol-disulfide isomerase/thioredoxin|nr:TlpA family protein disulfide reductase [Gemmatimonadales bacterium]
MIVSLLVAALLSGPGLAGPWRGALDLAGATLPFGIELTETARGVSGRLCNGRACEPFSGVRVAGDSVTFELADYAATIAAVRRGDSLVGIYRNVGNKGPRAIPFRASRGRWPAATAPAALAGRWDAWFEGDFGSSPRVLVFEDGPAGLEGTVIGNTGDYGHFGGSVLGGSVALHRFDGSFVYMLTGQLSGDTLRGIFHAGLRGQTPFVASRSRGGPHLTPPTELTTADSAPFRFAFPDLSGRVVRSDEARFRGKVLLVDIFGTWCPTCHDAAPTLVSLYDSRQARGLEVVGLAFEVSGDPAVDGPLVARFRDKFGIRYPLLLAGVNDVESAAATLPQLAGFTAFPTTLFIGRDGRVRRVHAGFYGPATGAQHEALVRDFTRTVDALLAEPAP